MSPEQGNRLIGETLGNMIAAHMREGGSGTR